MKILSQENSKLTTNMAVPMYIIRNSLPSYPKILKVHLFYICRIYSITFILGKLQRCWTAEDIFT